MIYLKLFENHSEYEDFTGSTEYVEPHVSLCEDESDVHYNLKRATGVTLNVKTLSLNGGETGTLVATVLPEGSLNTAVTWSSDDVNIATVDENGVVTAVSDGIANITVTTEDGGYTATCKVDVLDYVEIAGIKWSKKNIGASRITDTGLYFQWGDTQGYTVDQVTGSSLPHKDFIWTDYKYNGDGTSPDDDDMTKYNATDGIEVLLPEDDGAIANTGGKWKMPTYEDYVALSGAVDTAWTEDYKGSGVKGTVVTDKLDSTKELFFPACGRCVNGATNGAGVAGYYWQSKGDPIYGAVTPSDLYCGKIGTNKFDPYDIGLRPFGEPIRGILNE
jgi:hypothetical protein